jgi:hypothetical protein
MVETIAYHQVMQEIARGVRVDDGPVEVMTPQETYDAVMARFMPMQQRKV